MIPSEYGSAAPTSAKSSRSEIGDDDAGRPRRPAPLERAREQLQLRELDRLVDPLEDRCTSAPASTSSAARRSDFGVVFVYWKRPVSVTSAMYSASAISGVSSTPSSREQVAQHLAGRRRVGDDQVDVAEAACCRGGGRCRSRAARARAAPDPAPMRRSFAQSTATSTRSPMLVRQLAEQPVERHEARTRRQRRVAREVHDDVLAELRRARASSRAATRARRRPGSRGSRRESARARGSPSATA